MTTMEAEKLVHQLEEEHKADPKGFRGRVWRFIMLGYAAVHLLWIVCALLIFAVGWAVYESWITHHFEIVLIWKFLLLTGAGAIGALLLVARLLFYQPELPPAFEVSEKDAPALFALLREVREKVGAEEFSHVYLNADVNAAVVYLPSLMGLLPGETNLLIGVPLLAALTVPEVKAIVAHEMGHLQGRHGSFNGWVNRNRLLWTGLGLYMQRAGGLLSGPATAFFRWYTPQLQAYSLVNAREFEYQSDQLSVEVAGTEATARALVRVHALALYMEDQFEPLMKESIKANATVPKEIFPAMLETIRGAVERGELHAYVAEAMQKKNDAFDSHPSLANRLKVLGVAVTPDQESLPDSGLDLLKDEWPVVQELANHTFQQKMQKMWSDSHTRHLKNVGVLNRAYSKEKPPEKWNHQEVLEYAIAAWQSDTFELGWEWINYYISLQPEEAMGYLVRGQMAFERKSPACLDDLRRAATLSPKIAPLAYRKLITFAERYVPDADLAADRAALQNAEEKLLHRN